MRTHGRKMNILTPRREASGKPTCPHLDFGFLASITEENKGGHVSPRPGCFVNRVPAEAGTHQKEHSHGVVIWDCSHLSLPLEPASLPLPCWGAEGCLD